MNKPKHKLYDVAESLFVNQGLTSIEISKQLDISETTLSRWRKNMTWDNKRQTMLSTPTKIRELLLEELENVASGKQSKIDADALSKINKALSYIDGKIAINIVVAVLMEFDNWMADADPHIALEFTKYHKLYIAHRAEQDALKC